MLRNSKSKDTLADRIANILVAAPLNEDPEDETDGTKAQLEEHCEETNSDEEALLNTFRKQNIELLADVDESYAGKKGSRKDLAGSDEDSDDELEEADTQSETSEPQDEEDVSDHQHSGESNNSSQSEDEDHLSGESDAAEDNFTPMKETDVSAQVTKGLSVRNQLSVWENLLEMRIQLQKCLISANKMPQSQNYEQMKKESDIFNNKVGETKNSLSNVLDKLLLFQQVVLKNYPETKNLAQSESDAKTENSEDEEIPSDSEDDENHDQHQDIDIDIEPQVKKRKLVDYESEIGARHNKYRTYRNEVIKKWHDKTRIAAHKSNAPQHSIISHIEHTLSDKSKLIKRTQLKRSDYKILGVDSKKEIEDNTKQVEQIDEYNTEIFDDDDFYHQMLRELIEMKSADVTDPVQLGRQWIQLQNLRSKMKRKVDTRASKGRKIRYAIHSKLVNFMAPIDENLWTDEAKTELYSSLFGKNQSVISV